MDMILPVSAASSQSTSGSRSGDGTEAAYLRLDRLRKSYDGHQDAVSSISLDVRRGEFLTLLGPSGSGKTTVLMMIAGFEQPTAGRISLAGRDLSSTAPYHRNIGMVFQNYALFPHMSVRRNLEFPLRMRRIEGRERQRRVSEVLEMVGLSAMGARRPQELSGGQQQRVALARALVFQPDILLLDEPLSALDKNLRLQMQSEIRRLHRKLGITSVYITHDQDEAMTMSDRIAVFHEGRIEQLGTPLDLYHRPSSRFVAGFLGDCNLLQATVVDPVSGTVRLVEGMAPIRTGHALDVAAGQTVTLMMRPESLRQSTAGAPPLGEINFDLAITEVSNYGEAMLVTGHWKGLTLRARVPGRRTHDFVEGAVVSMQIDPGDLWPVPPS